MTRDDPPEGYEYHWVPTEQVDGPDMWRRPPCYGSKCRFTVGPGHRTCRRPAVFEMRRGGAGWWGYCADHLYGREVRDGVLMISVLRPIDDRGTGDSR